MKLFQSDEEDDYDAGSWAHHACKRDEEFGYSPDLYNKPTIKHFQDDNFYDGGIKHFQD